MIVVYDISACLKGENLSLNCDASSRWCMDMFFGQSKNSWEYTCIVHHIYACVFNNDACAGFPL